MDGFLEESLEKYLEESLEKNSGKKSEEIQEIFSEAKQARFSCRYF